MNGDLCYANMSDAPVATWVAYFANGMRSARHRPWMPAAGNHENEVGNGPQGYLSYRTRFALPGNGSGYSGGLQRAWLEAELAAARQAEEIDWIVVCLHQVAMSSVHLNGAGRSSPPSPPRGWPTGISPHRSGSRPSMWRPAEPGGTTSITVTYHGAAAGSPVYAPLDRFVLRKPVGVGSGAWRRAQLAQA